MSARDVRPRRSRARRVVVGLASSAAVLVALFLAGELAVRWHVHEGLGPALRSFADPAAVPLRDPSEDASFLQDPELGYTLNPRLEGIHPLGFRGAAAVPKPSGAFRVLVMGDSVAWDEGGFVDLVSRQLSRGRPRFDVVNAAVPGYTTHQERLFFEHRLQPLEADLVLLQYTLNDNHRFLHRVTATGDRLFTPEAKRALLPEGEGLFTRFGRWSYLLVEIQRRMWARRLGSESPWPWVGREDFGPAWRADTWSELEREVLGMRDTARDRGARFAVVAVPYEPQLRADLLERDPDYALYPQLRLRALCEREGIALLDLFEDFAAERDGDPLFRDGIHLTARGHALAAQSCARFLEGEELVPPR